MMINKASEKGSPCQRPCIEGKKVNADPLIITKNQAPEMHALIDLHQFLSKPFFEELETEIVKRLYHMPFACLT